ncbi:MAG: helix-turn-helix transcriptional regulator [Prolixibacteraceae bacterium]|nr:WYL domain-containing protein [Prolixibacteraceae bacterium]
MSKSKNAMIRYRVLDRCFRNSLRKFFISDLIAECSRVLSDSGRKRITVSKRQIYNDISYMESDQGWNIDLLRKCDGKKVYFRYRDPAFSIDHCSLSDKETQLLSDVLRLLDSFKGIESFSWLKETIARLRIEFIQGNRQHQYICFEDNPYMIGLDKLGEIYQYVCNKNVLQIKYHGFREEGEQEWIIHPHFLKQFNFRWFLLGYSEELGMIVNIPLDRIISVSPMVKKALSPIFSYRDYFENIIGVTYSDNIQLQKVVVEVCKDLIPFIESKPLHVSQVIKEYGKEWNRVELFLIINYELRSLLLSYGMAIRVVSPQTLVDEIQDEVNRIQSYYL